MLRFRIPRLSRTAILRRAALAYLILWMLSPPLAYGAIWRVLAVLAMLSWLALDTLAPRSVLFKPNWPVLGSAVFVFYTIFIEWLVTDSASVNRHFAIWIMFFCLLVGESFRRGRDGDARFCFWLILLILPIWSITSLRGLDTMGGHAARVVVRSSAEARELMEEGMGGYTFVYTVLLCLPILAQFAIRPGTVLQIKSRQRGWRLLQGLLWLNFALAVLLILRAGYSIALIIAMLAVAMVLLVRTRRTVPFAMSVCLVGLMVLVASISIKPGLDLLQDVARGTEYNVKIHDIRASLEEEHSTGTVGYRTERYIRSVKAFLKNPVIGTLAYDDAGKHSAILDRFSQYGLVLGLLFFALLAYVPFRMVRDPRVPVGMAIGFLVAALGFPLLNNVFMSWGLVLYVFARGASVVMGIPLDRDGQEHHKGAIARA